MLKPVMVLVMAVGLLSCTDNSQKEPDELDSKVNDLLSKMSIEEKVGQMTQLTVDMILKDNSATEIDPAKLKNALVDHHVGSILNVKGRAYSMNEWHILLKEIQDVAIGQTPNKIPVLYGIDAIHGANYIANSTLFPHNIGIAASRNSEIAQRGAEVTALETRASGIRWNFDPVVGLGRQPLWPRFEETFGEDVYLTSKMGFATIRGYEGDDLSSMTNVASCMKHFMGYSVPLTGKDRTPSYIPDIQLRNIFLPPFKAAVEAGASTVMINSGEVNGIPVHGSKFFLQQILRDELGFKGLAVTDWEDIIRLHTRHRIAATPKEAVKIAINAGIDMSMVPMSYSFYDYLVELVKEKEVPMTRIDEAVGRILKLKFQVGLFDNPYVEKEAAQNFGKQVYRQDAKKAAIESITLLKNENNLLPISKDSKVLIAGPGGNNIPTLHGSWSYTWQGTDATKYPTSNLTLANEQGGNNVITVSEEGKYDVNSYNTLTVKAAFESKLGSNNVINISNTNYDDQVNYDTKTLLKMARGVDYVILCLGENAYAESPGVIDDLNLDSRQIALAKAAVESNKPVILVLLEGRPRIISSIEPMMDGILMAYRPGSEGAGAITDIIFGDANPSGVLPFTYPRYAGDVILYDHKGTERIREDKPNTYGNGGYNPQYPFGHGLSYTTFEYSGLSLSSKTLNDKGEITVKVKVKNTGKLAGKHAVELYTKDLYASITPADRKLKGFQKISLKAGEEKTVTFSLKAEDLSFINEALKRVTEPGDFEVMIGSLKESFSYN